MRDQDQRQLWRCHHLARLSCSHWYNAAISIAFTTASSAAISIASTTAATSALAPALS